MVIFFLSGYHTQELRLEKLYAIRGEFHPESTGFYASS